MTELVFCKLGGSVLTDKAQPEALRREVLARLAGEVARSRALRPGLRLVLGHGSGSFGHTAAQRHGTRAGVQGEAGWRGFAEVADAAARLNRLVTAALLAAGVPAWSLPPSASARARDGELVALASAPVAAALERGLVPLVHGDVALDEVRGGTIVSTEQVFAFLARALRPARIVLVTAVDGVFEADPRLDPAARHLAEITPANWEAVRRALGGSHAPDVTGGMAAKVEAMAALARDLPGLAVRVLSAERPGALQAALCDPEGGGGTLIRWI